jgi:hypothetical protein
METVSALVISTAHEEEAVYSYENASRTDPTESVVTLLVKSKTCGKVALYSTFAGQKD